MCKVTLNAVNFPVHVMFSLLNVPPFLYLFIYFLNSLHDSKWTESRVTACRHTHTLRAWHQNVIGNRWTEPRATLQVGFGAPLVVFTEVTTQTTCDQDMSQTYKWQIAISRWNINRELRFRNTKLFPPAQTPLSPSVRLLLLLGLRPTMSCAVGRHLQHLPEPSPLQHLTTLHRHSSVQGSLRQFKAFISCFFPFTIFIGCNSELIFNALMFLWIAAAGPKIPLVYFP